MRRWMAAGAVAICSLAIIINALKLRNREKFFAQLAAGALQGHFQPMVPPLQNVPPVLTPSMPTVPTEEKPAIPAVDTERAGKLESMQKLLDRKIQQSQELKEKLDAELKFMKEEGLLSQAKGTSALQGPKVTPGQQGAIGAMLPDLGAPIIFMEPPPVTPSQVLDSAEVAETTLAQIGDYSSPAMKAVREYELKKLGAIAGTNLEQIRKEIRETEAAIEKRKKERDALTNKLKADGRALAKGGNRQLELEATFANADLKEKSKELNILADKLTQLKMREKNLIKREGPGKEATEELEREEGEEAEIDNEISGEDEEEFL